MLHFVVVGIVVMKSKEPRFGVTLFFKIRMNFRNFFVSTAKKLRIFL